MKRSTLIETDDVRETTLTQSGDITDLTELMSGEPDMINLGMRIKFAEDYEANQGYQVKPVDYKVSIISEKSLMSAETEGKELKWE